MKEQEANVINSLIAELEVTISLATRFNQQNQPKFLELSHKKKLLEEVLKVSESRFIREVQLRDLWLRNQEV